MALFAVPYTNLVDWGLPKQSSRATGTAFAGRYFNTSRPGDGFPGEHVSGTAADTATHSVEHQANFDRKSGNPELPCS